VSKTCTFCIPYKQDSEDRKENLEIVKAHLAKLHEEVMVHEVTERPFHRTRYLNSMLNKATTPVACLMDTDALIALESMREAIDMCLKGTTIVVPYGGEFLDVPRDKKREPLSSLDKLKLESLSLHNDSVGGCVFVNRKQYLSMGGENENMVQWGEEDLERIDRVVKLGGKVEKLPGKLFHLYHPRKYEGMFGNKYYHSNRAERLKIQKLPKDDLVSYVNSWSWR